MFKKIRWYFIKRKHQVTTEPEENIIKVKINHQYNPELERKAYIKGLQKKQSLKFNL